MKFLLYDRKQQNVDIGLGGQYNLQGKFRASKSTYPISLIEGVFVGFFFAATEV